MVICEVPRSMVTVWNVDSARNIVAPIPSGRRRRCIMPRGQTWWKIFLIEVRFSSHAAAVPRDRSFGANVSTCIRLGWLRWHRFTLKFLLHFPVPHLVTFHSSLESTAVKSLRIDKESPPTKLSFALLGNFSCCLVVCLLSAAFRAHFFVQLSFKLMMSLT